MILEKRNQSMIILLLLAISSYSQNSILSESDTTFYQIMDKMDRFYSINNIISHDSVSTFVKENIYGRWQWFWRDRVDKQGNFSKYGQTIRSVALKFQKGVKKSAASSMWTPLGPTTEPIPWSPGNIGTGVAQVRSIWANSSSIYIGLNSGGFWKRDGSSWSNLTDNIICMSVYDIAVDYTGKIYIATGYSGGLHDCDGFGFGIYYSTNGGVTWVTDKMTSVPDEDLLMYRVMVDPTDEDIVYALSRHTVYKSTDGGDNWNELTNTPTLSNNDWYVDMDFKANDPNTIFICSEGRNEAFGYVLRSKLFKTENGGSDWSNDLSTNLTNTSDDPRWMNIATTPDDPNAVFVIYYDNTGNCTLEKSTNNGSSWSTLVNQDYIRTDFYVIPQLYISPDDNDEIYIGALRPYKYDYINHEFDRIGSNLHNDTRDFYLVNSGGTTIYTGNDAGVAYSTNGGSTWTKMNDGLQGALFFGIAISEIDIDKYLGGVGDCGTHFFDGSQWKNMKTGGDGGASLIDNLRPDTMFAMANTVYYYTHNNGVNWSSTHEYAPEYYSPIVQHPSNGRVYIGQREISTEWSCRVKYSDDGGLNWGNYSINFPGDRITAMAISESNPAYFYVAKVFYESNGVNWDITSSIVRTTNDGTSWSDISSGLGSVLTEARITAIEIHPENPDVVWICFGGLTSGEKVYWTTNGGSTWTNISNNLDNFPVMDLEYDYSNHRLYLANDIGVYFKEYGGNTWSRMGDLPYVLATEIKLNHVSGKLYTSTWGRGLWETTIEGYCYDGTVETITSNTTWSSDIELCKNLIIQSGTLSIQGNLTMPFDANITIKSGATLTINGGTIYNADIIVESGGNLLIQNNGKITINNNDELQVDVGGIFDYSYGDVEVISGY